MATLTRAATAADYREIARRRLPPFLFHYIESGAGREVSTRRNNAIIDEILLEQRVMRNVEKIDIQLELFGTKLSMPVVLGPVGLAGLFARRGEVQALKAANAHGIPFCLSTLGICPVGELVASAATPPWFQLYVIRDRAFMRDLIQSVSEAGVKVLVLTVDVPVSGIRHRDRQFGLSSGFVTQALQAARRPRWIWDVAIRGRPLIFGSIAQALPGVRNLEAFWPWLGANFDPTVTWDDLAFVRQHWRGPILVKGIMNAEDGCAALAAGADGLIVSNHGGRQLEGTPAPIEMLPTIVEAIDGRIPVLMDGGIRSGIDVVKALASGANACLLGRAWAYALAAGGEGGLNRYLDDLRREIANTLALTGCIGVSQIGPHLIATPGAGPASSRS